MVTIRLEDAQPLADLVARLRPGEPLVVKRGDQAVARLSAEPPIDREPRKAGSAKGLLVILAEDDEHLDDFAEHL